MDGTNTYTHKNKRIAVFTNGWSTEYLSFIIEGIRKKAVEDSVDVFIFTSYILWGEAGLRRQTKLNLYRLPNPSFYDGAIILTNTFNAPDEQTEVQKYFQGENVPLISTEVKIPGVALVGTSNYDGMYELAEHLMDKHDVKDVIYLNGIMDNEESNTRRKALEDALATRGLKLAGILQGDFEFYSTINRMEEWFATDPKMPDAFVCANDYMALGVIYKLYEHGYSVPEDVIVTGFDHIREGRTTCPMIATVSRQWSRMGENVYEELKNLMDDYDPDYERMYESKFIPSESCGCEPSENSKKNRLDRIRNLYGDTSLNDMLEFQFQEIRVAMAKADSKEAFFETACECIKLEDYIGNDFCICTQKQFFEKRDDEYEPELDGYDRQMDILFERKDGVPVPQRKFDISEVYPGYVKQEGKSDIFVITPLTNLDHNIGYLAVKNNPKVLYDLCFKKFVNNMDTLLETVRQYIFAQESYRRLNNIYMTDFLTGMYNRTGCERVLFSYIESEKAQGRETMLLFTDIDNMKLINDRYGHLHGDLAIKSTAQAIKATLSDEWNVGRFGGDEFIAAGPVDTPIDIEEYRAKFRAELRRITEELKLGFKLTASVGYYRVTADSDGTMEDYIRIADASMYEEKERAHRESEFGHHSG